MIDDNMTAQDRINIRHDVQTQGEGILLREMLWGINRIEKICSGNRLKRSADNAPRGGASSVNGTSPGE